MQAKASSALQPIEDKHINRSGMLSVGNGHTLYWLDWGNPQIQKPIFFVHGGPGAGFSEKDFSKFDPHVHRVIFHDQRGSGRSVPFATNKHNTTQDLIEDINKLKEHLGFDVLSLYGTSWGSTLSLLYAEAFPENVEKMLIGGIFLSRRIDNDFYLKGKIATHFPEVWERFAGNVPDKYRDDPGAYFLKMMAGQNAKLRSKFAREWMLYEASILKLDYVPHKVEADATSFASESLAYLEAHYILNDCFIPENHIIKNAERLKTIDQIVIVQGRYDFITMPVAAYELHQAIGANSRLHFVTSGHSSADTVQREVMRAYTNMMWQ